MTPADSLQQARTGDPAIWIHLPETAEPGGDGPLACLTFAVKDNIDVAGMPTTAACPDYACPAAADAPVVAALRAAGAVPVGKTNLDQFATGLVGTRSPYGVPANPFHPDYIPGGSSSGSAAAVARGQVDFALGTDTAGSGRIPAAFNGLVGLKPTRGLLSTRGVVPACRSLDCVSVFTRTLALAQDVFAAANRFDPDDPWSRRDRAPRHRPGPPVFGVPRADQLDFTRMTAYATLFEAAVERMTALGWKPVEVDLTPFFETAQLLYGGPWVAERTAAIDRFLAETPGALHPVTRQIIEGGRRRTAVETFQSLHRLRELQRTVEPLWEQIHFLLTPTAPAHYTLAEVEADPVNTNTHLGTYTNWMNLLDLCAVAIPAGTTPAGLPFGVTLQAPALHDEYLLDRAGEVLDGTPSPAAPPPGWMTLAVCGAHMEGFPLNGQLTERGSVFRKRTRSAPGYRLIVLPGPVPKPGMIRVNQGGGPVELELWDMPVDQVGSFLALIPPPLGLGTVELEDGTRVKGFCCEAAAAEGAEDITPLGSWRAYCITELKTVPRPSFLGHPIQIGGFSNSPGPGGDA